MGLLQSAPAHSLVQNQVALCIDWYCFGYCSKQLTTGIVAVLYREQDKVTQWQLQKKIIYWKGQGAIQVGNGACVP